MTATAIKSRIVLIKQHKTIAADKINNAKPTQEDFIDVVS